MQDYFIIVIATDHFSNETIEMENYGVTMNQYFEIQLPPVNEIFNYSMNETITPYLFLTNTSMFPNFLIFDNINNSMKGIAFYTDMKQYSLMYVGTNSNGYAAAISFSLTVRM